jgi:hypothetical protein
MSSGCNGERATSADMDGNNVADCLVVCDGECASWGVIARVYDAFLAAMLAQIVNTW